MQFGFLFLVIRKKTKTYFLNWLLVSRCSKNNEIARIIFPLVNCIKLLSPNFFHFRSVFWKKVSKNYDVFVLT